GKACAEELAAEGCNLTIFSRNLRNIKKTAQEIENKYKNKVLYLKADTTSLKDLKKVVKKTVDEFESIHILVNNSGGPPFGYFEDFNTKDWQMALELNLLSIINLTKEVLPYMKEQNWGRIVNITSVAVKQPIEGLILSNTVRTAVLGLTKTLSNEYAKYNVLFNNVCPGRIMTDRIVELANKRAKLSKKSYNRVIKDMEIDIPVGRIGKPSELSAMVVFLSSEKASYITGNTIQIDGGLVKNLY
nr:SDR family oxidoreductase [Candidatus Dadabacteria bacterium]NIQ13000.1 SDR family oxidoreductase [Candidatus Dadabacteria bacterium]